MAEKLQKLIQEPIIKRRSQTLLRTLPTETLERWKAKWHSPKAFLAYWHPSNTIQALTKPIQAWTEEYPTLNQATAMFGAPTVRMFIGTQLGAYLNLNTTANARLTEEQLQTMCREILSVMRNYTVSEVTLFFAQLRTGMWRMYGNTSREICDKFRHEFMDYRNACIDEAKSLKRQQRNEERQPRCVTYEEYKKSKINH